eukprot:11668542-Alexandrium_andersonii.AAC.1
MSTTALLCVNALLAWKGFGACGTKNCAQLCQIRSRHDGWWLMRADQKCTTELEMHFCPSV